MTFWTDSKLSPTRQFRFMVSNGTNWWWASSCSKPSYEISTEEYKLINHKYKYPGVATWNDVNLTIVDVTGQAKSLVQSLFDSGYNISGDKDGLSKKQMSKSLSYQGGNFTIQQLNAEGNAVETWTLKNPFITSVNLGDLNYETDGLSTITLGLRYDFASCQTRQAGHFGTVGSPPGALPSS